MEGLERGAATFAMCNHQEALGGISIHHTEQTPQSYIDQQKPPFDRSDTSLPQPDSRCLKLTFVSMTALKEAVYLWGERR